MCWWIASHRTTFITLKVENVNFEILKFCQISLKLFLYYEAKSKLAKIIQINIIILKISIHFLVIMPAPYIYFGHLTRWPLLYSNWTVKLLKQETKNVVTTASFWKTLNRLLHFFNKIQKELESLFETALCFSYSELSLPTFYLGFRWLKKGGA